MPGLSEQGMMSPHQKNKKGQYTELNTDPRSSTSGQAEADDIRGSEYLNSPGQSCWSIQAAWGSHRLRAQCHPRRRPQGANKSRKSPKLSPKIFSSKRLHGELRRPQQVESTMSDIHREDRREDETAASPLEAAAVDAPPPTRYPQLAKGEEVTPRRSCLFATGCTPRPLRLPRFPPAFPRRFPRRSAVEPAPASDSLSLSLSVDWFGTRLTGYCRFPLQRPPAAICRSTLPAAWPRPLTGYRRSHQQRAMATGFHHWQ